MVKNEETTVQHRCNHDMGGERYAFSTNHTQPCGVFLGIFKLSSIALKAFLIGILYSKEKLDVLCIGRL